jgi:hypothetical protein
MAAHDPVERVLSIRGMRTQGLELGTIRSDGLPLRRQLRSNRRRIFRNFRFARIVERWIARKDAACADDYGTDAATGTSGVAAYGNVAVPDGAN